MRTRKCVTHIWRSDRPWDKKRLIGRGSDKMTEMTTRGPEQDLQDQVTQDREEGGRRYSLEGQIGFLLRKAQQRHLNIFMTHIGEDLTAQQFAALAKLLEVGPSSQNSLGRQTAMDVATIKGVVTRLRDRGLVEKSPDPTDKRLHLIALTAEGRRTIERVLPQAREISRMTLAPLDRGQQQMLLRLLKKIS